MTGITTPAVYLHHFQFWTSEILNARFLLQSVQYVKKFLQL
jgi:hypothetical protein